jgi:hypothetical protein
MSRPIVDGLVKKYNKETPELLTQIIKVDIEVQVFRKLVKDG